MAKKKFLSNLDIQFFSEDKIKLIPGKKAKRKKTSSKNEIKFTSEDDMQPHSEAKVALYGKYLEKFLAILGVVDIVTQINIFDVYCGTGIYKNGKYGSPIIAYKTILKIKKYLESKNKTVKPISLIVNDGNHESIGKVSNHLLALNSKEPCCNISWNNLEARAMLEKITNQLKKQNKYEKNLIFIDPTGYKEIHKDDLYKLLQNKKSEVVLFLPISFMHRFQSVVQTDFDNPSYVHLRRFIYDFFDESHPIRNNSQLDIIRFVYYLKEALRFDRKFYATSFLLQRNKNNFYALFFITPNILGLEKIIEAKWDFDHEQGEGFVYEKEDQSTQLMLFEVKNEKFENKMKRLEKLLRIYITENPNCTNCELYELVLLNDFKPSHATQILKQWQNKSLIQVWDEEKAKDARKGAFYLHNDYYKTKGIRVTYKLL